MTGTRIPIDRTNPFAELGIAATLDRARIKRAYFEAIARTPPHRDAAAFTRVRAAYEALMRPGGPEAASLQLPPDPAQDGAAYRERYATRLEEARARLRQRAASETALAHFVACARSTSLEALIERLRR